MMLARVADSLYWIGRYLERTERSARLLEVHLDLTLYQSPDDVAESWRRLCRVLDVDAPADGAVDPAVVAREIADSPDNPSSIVNCIGAARDNGRQVREVISSEMWAQLNTLFLRTRPVRTAAAWDTPRTGFLRSLQDGVNLFKGITDSTFSHGEGWSFLRLGRFVERGAAATRLLEAYLGDLPAQGDDQRARPTELRWLGLLRSCAALEAFTRRHTADQIHSAIEQIARLTGTGAVRAAELAQGAGRLRAQLEYANAEEILAGRPAEYLAAIHEQIESVHTLVAASYTGYALTPSRVVA